MQPLGSREVGEQTYSSLGFTSGRGGLLPVPNACTYLGGKKQRKTNQVIQCLQKNGIIISRQDSEAPAGGRGERNRRNE